jgi:hypothetical protein
MRRSPGALAGIRNREPMPYYTIPQRLDRLRAKSAAESARPRHGPRYVPSVDFLVAVYTAKRELEAEIDDKQHKLKLFNDLIAIYESYGAKP